MPSLDPDWKPMRIVQIVTYISADGAFGGPVAVATAQCQELARLGHAVELWAAWDGAARVDLPGVTVQLFRVHRGAGRPLATLLSVRMTIELWRLRRRYDALHLHFGRDLVSLSAWLALRSRRRRMVLQPHGMVMPDRRPKSRIVDALIGRPALRAASRVLTLTDREDTGVREVARGPVRTQRIANGLEVDASLSLDRTGGPVLFLARLHPRKHVLRFAEAARTVLERGVEARFEVVGPDEGDLPALRAFTDEHGLADRLRYEGAATAEQARDHLRGAVVYVLPSTGEVFPMTVVEALSFGTPVVLTDDCGLAPGLAAAAAAAIVPSEPALLADAIERVIADEPYRRGLAARGRAYAAEHFSIAQVARVLVHAYEAER